jgi:hypothetical protein
MGRTRAVTHHDDFDAVERLFRDAGFTQEEAVRLVHADGHRLPLEPTLEGYAGLSAELIAPEKASAAGAYRLAQAHAVIRVALAARARGGPTGGDTA